MLCRKWRGKVGRLGLDLGDGSQALLDLRFADDILLRATMYIDAGVLLDQVVVCLSQGGLVLNADKTKVMTTETQPVQFVHVCFIDCSESRNKNSDGPQLSQFKRFYRTALPGDKRMLSRQLAHDDQHRVVS